MADGGDLIADRYRLLDRVGGGAMGVVWRAHDVVLDRDVAVKELVLHGGMTEAQAREANERALREARIAARLHHPHAISVYDVVEHAGRPCLIMEFLAARTLSDLIAERGGLPVDEVRRIGVQIAGALAAAHTAGIVHRDVKPGNVLLTVDGTAKLTDFGISRAAGDGTLTATGVLAGTPAYLAPEVAQGFEATHASDVFSLGATLYCAIEGTPPFGLDANPIALLYRIANNPAPPPRNAGPLTDVLTRLLQADPDRRPTARNTEHTLTDIRPIPAPTPAPALVPAMPPVPPPSVPPSLPPAQPDGRGRRRAIVAALVLGVLLITGVLVAVMANTGSNNGSNTAGPVPTTPTHHPTTTANPRPRTTTRTSTTTQLDVRGQLADAIVGYYQLVPGNLSSAWTHMTADYQQNHAGGMGGYQRFWRPIARVTLSDVTVSPPNTVTATISYFYQSGNVAVERTQFELVRRDGMWKIANSTVLSHTGKAG